ncbi:MAG: hypothetical protein Q8Q01_01285 [archaeon]|nr:hypothetical protein [archaeon]
MEQKEASTIRKGVNIWYVSFIVIILLLFSLLVVRPGLIGYGIYQDVESSGYSLDEFAQNVQSLNMEVAAVKTNLSLHQEFLQMAQGEALTAREELTVCESDRKSLEKEVVYCQESCKLKEDLLASTDSKITAAVEEQTKELSDAKDLCIDTLTKKDEDLASLQSQYNSLVSTMARSICCKQKVDNPEINSYDVIENKIVCLSSGSNSLSC